MDSEIKTKIGEYVPPKNWTELTDPEKIDRMKEVIHELQRQVGQAQAQVHNLRKNLKNHIHFNDRVLLVKEAQDYDDSPNETCGVASLSNPKYF